MFTTDVLDRLARLSRPEPSKWDSNGNPTRERHLVLGVTRQDPCGWRSAHRRAWASYLRVAAACGLLDTPGVPSRLLGNDDDGFRGAMAECCTAWFFARRRRAKVTRNPASKTTKNFDLVVERDGLVVHAEVKAPYVPQLNRSWSNDDSKVLRKCVEGAGSQFTKGQANIVVLVPLLPMPVWMARHHLLKATIGEPALNVFVSKDDSKPPPPEPTFLQRGKLAKLWPADGGAFRTDLTRVSAVMTIEQRRVDGARGARLTPVVVVIHNPFAAKPLNPTFFGRVPQWVLRDGTMCWSDRYTGR